jgi:hypothetical protein
MDRQHLRAVFFLHDIKDSTLSIMIGIALPRHRELDVDQHTLARPVPKTSHSVLTTVCLTAKKKLSITASSVSYNIEDETITLEFPRALHVGSSWILDITYIGLVNDKLNGFYRSAYTDANNNIQ